MENQSNKLACGGGAPGSGNTTRSFNETFLSKWVSIFLITTGPSIQAMTFMAPPQFEQVSISILNTRLSRYAHVIAAWRCVGVFSVLSAAALLLRLPRFAGVTAALCLLLGANTP